MDPHHDTIVILDFGSQYTQLIARRIREFHVFSVILPAHSSLQEILSHHPKGLIFSGGPASVTQAHAPKLANKIFQLGIPILGICYGMQLIAHHCGGTVKPTPKREFGRADLHIDDTNDLFKGIKGKKAFPVWMSHGDSVEQLPQGFQTIGHTTHAPIAAIRKTTASQQLFGIQFHPEVVHTQHGSTILKNFACHICQCKPTWTMGSFIDQAVTEIRQTVGQGKVICALSGGVDSTVAAALVHRAIGDQLTCLFIDNGFMRKDEVTQLQKTFNSGDHIPVRIADHASTFLSALGRTINPERKRKIIGRQFIKVFEYEAASLGTVNFLVQGTLYPDVIESLSVNGPSATIKTHHNVGGLPKRMKFKLIEPFRELFKDEVRQLGLELGLPEHIVWRQPFPGPGLAIRILGAVTSERLTILREADAIVREEIEQAGLSRSIWQFFAVLLPIQTVGVMGDQRTYEFVIAIRAVTSTDGMTADWAEIPHPVLAKMSNRIINEVHGVNRVVYDISSKPPATIEWE
jgi:GMP synthase (glutamine-hydrolysing)